VTVLYKLRVQPPRARSQKRQDSELPQRPRPAPPCQPLATTAFPTTFQQSDETTEDNDETEPASRRTYSAVGKAPPDEGQLRHHARTARAMETRYPNPTVTRAQRHTSMISYSILKPDIPFPHIPRYREEVGFRMHPSLLKLWTDLLDRT